MHAEFMHAAGAPHVPLLQVWTALPLHCVWPGAHIPVQTPPMHVWLVHPTGAPHDPAALHVCMLLPEHCVVAGEHATQPLFTQAGVAPEHVVWVCHVPLAVHDWMELPRHSVCAGAQTPEHVPLMHVCETQGAALV
jgi:hypothetical protein